MILSRFMPSGVGFWFQPRFKLERAWDRVNGHGNLMSPFMNPQERAHVPHHDHSHHQDHVQRSGAHALVTTTPEAVLQGAVAHHNAGRLAEAEAGYRQVLAAAPQQPVALHLLGVIAHQVGQHRQAVTLIRQALTLAPDYPEARNNLALALAALKQHADAAAELRQAVALKPNYPEAHNNLALQYQALGERAGAEAHLRQALHLQPHYPDALCNRGHMHLEAGRHQKAIDSYRCAIQSAPQLAEAHNGLGCALRASGQLEAAHQSLEQAVACDPAHASAHHNLGHACAALGRVEQAWAAHRQAIALDPEAPEHWAGAADLLKSALPHSVGSEQWPFLQQLLEHRAVRPIPIIPALINALRQDSVLRALFDTHLDPGTGGRGDAARHHDHTRLKQLSKVPLLLSMMQLAPLCDAGIEALFIRLRRTLLITALETLPHPSRQAVLPFAAALAMQCAINEYIYPLDAEQSRQLKALQAQAAQTMEDGDTPDALVLTALGCYRMLHQEPFAEALATWMAADASDDAPLQNITVAPDNRPSRLPDQLQATWLHALLRQQLSEPLQEQRLAAGIPALTPIETATSQAVRDQYEENPYPRWIKSGLPSRPQPLEILLRQSLPGIDLEAETLPAPPLEVLIAGCGTGQHAITSAAALAESRITAIDLSRRSLAYALRKSREMGITNIDYAQADIMQLGNLDGRRFDPIESVGVLHHLADPLAGWRVLCGLLKPGGLMKIGLYSEIARKDLIAGRHLIAKYGFRDTPEDMRQSRIELRRAALAEDPALGRIIQGSDFYALSNYRGPENPESDPARHDAQRSHTTHAVRPGASPSRRLCRSRRLARL